MKKGVFFAFTLLLIFLIIPSVSAITSRQDMKYIISIQDDTIVQDVGIVTVLQPGWYFSSLQYSTSGDIISAEQTGGKQCQPLEQSKYKDYTVFKCINRFTDGEGVDLRISSRCNCTEKDGINLYIYPFDAGVGEDQEGSAEDIIHAPPGYFIFNTTITDAHVEESAEGVTITFQNQLRANQSLSDIYGPLFFHLKRIVDFSNMKTLQANKFKIIYPSGFESEADKLAKDTEALLPALAAYAGMDFENITLSLKNDSSSINGYGGFTDSFSGQINMSIDAYNGVFPHELCHLSQDHLYLPSWFGEGQATNCEMRHFAILGRDAEAKFSREILINNSRANVRLDLQNWTPGYYGGDNITGIDKGYGQAYLLLHDLLEVVNMTEFYTQSRKDFAGYRRPLPNDAIICKMNNVSNSNVTPIFSKYGFAESACNEHTYDFLKEDKPKIYLQILGVAILIGFAILVIYVFIFLPIRFILRLFRRIRGGKDKP